MKINLVLSAALLLVTANCFSQTPAKRKQAEQKKATVRPLTAGINPVIKRDSLIRMTTKSQANTTTTGALNTKKTASKTSPIKK